MPMAKIPRLWPFFLAAAIVAFGVGYILFGIGISPLILHGHHCAPGNTTPACATVPSPTWHANAGVAALIASMVLAVAAAGLLVAQILAKVRRRTSRCS